MKTTAAELWDAARESTPAALAAGAVGWALRTGWAYLAAPVRIEALRRDHAAFAAETRERWTHLEERLDRLLDARDPEGRQAWAVDAPGTAPHTAGTRSHRRPGPDTDPPGTAGIP